ncbi:hypothetical protein [Klenkia sp. PcliD-1-E]|uniref:hypothetical protein n=1 Tax=Klenkia sp. PcliD-1-E TaxID=2954492 RepID=UPI0020977BA0|nr:hypothetical protein [Klenkia sp. PcliD-1-E]MCO7218372.1 hypothetical protein [Klenkia sp. PcliD-1-E]
MAVHRPGIWLQALNTSGVFLAGSVAEGPGLRALGAVQGDLETGDAADSALTQLVLTSSGPAAPAQALAAAVDGAADASVVVSTEHQVGAVTAGGAGHLVVVVPVEGRTGAAGAGAAGAGAADSCRWR